MRAYTTKWYGPDDTEYQIEGTVDRFRPGSHFAPPEGGGVEISRVIGPGGKSIGYAEFRQLAGDQAISEIEDQIAEAAEE